MINTIYRLKSPRCFEITFSELKIAQNVIIRPLLMSICRADQRYFQGTRDINILRAKLPMALIHEAIGEVVYSGNSDFNLGDKVVMIPNIPKEKDDIISENYLRSSKFCSSSTDGFMQEYVSLPSSRVIKLPDDLDLEVAAFIELVSVSVHAITRYLRFSHKRRNTIGIWGDGNLGYITAAILKYLLPTSRIVVFGVNEEKLVEFSFVDDSYLITDIPLGLCIDHAFECVGGNGSPRAIDQIIDMITPEGTISLLGVSEYPVAINTRMILEKGLRIFGSSRSGRNDFINTLDLLSNNPSIVNILSGLVRERIHVKQFLEIQEAFELDLKNAFGKTIIYWNI